MDPREDDDLPSDDSDNDPLVRELRAELVRLEAQLDQLLAAERERAAETAELRARMDELERGIEQLKSRYRWQARMWVWIAGLYGASIGMGISWLLR
jgi:uncharacterized protein involved in exopolysaccharide biosynthesis